MKYIVRELGKVCVTPKGVWDINKSYERIDLVYDKDNSKSYIAKKDVPPGVQLVNEEYWQLVAKGVAGEGGTGTDEDAIHSENFTSFEYES